MVKSETPTQDYYNIRLLKENLKDMFQPYPIFATASTVLENKNLLFVFLGNFVIEVVNWKFDNVRPS